MYVFIYLNNSILNKSAAERKTEDALEAAPKPVASDGDRECCTGFSVFQKLTANVSSAQNASACVI